MYVYTDNGIKIELMEPPLGHGGEGAVYEMKGFDHRVAKIYSKDAEKRRDKIEAMCSISDEIAADPALERVAWPLGALYLDPQRSQFAGFGMRRIKAKCSMADLEEYPAPPKCDASLKEKVDALIELTEIVDALHRHDQVLGDLNDDNIVLCQDGHIGIVDADSFHAHIAGVTYPCVFCMPGFIAPEILRSSGGQDFSTIGPDVFNEKTDNFSLAIHIFKMLMNGVHPFHCLARKIPGKSLPAPVSIDKRVMRCESAFFGTARNVEVPKFAPKLNIFPKDMNANFELAFKRGDRNPNDRPSAGDWNRTLKNYRSELTHCGANHDHWYMNSLAACPYCDAEKATAKPVAKTGATATKQFSPIFKNTGGAAKQSTPTPKPKPKPVVAPTAVGAINKKMWWFGLGLGTYLMWFLLAITAAWLTDQGVLADFATQTSALGNSIGYPICMFISAGLYGFFSTRRTYKSLATGIAFTILGLVVAFLLDAAGSLIGVDLTDIFSLIGVLVLVAITLALGYFVLTHLDVVIKIGAVLFVLRFLYYLFFE